MVRYLLVCMLSLGGLMHGELSGKVSGPSGWVRISVSPVLAQAVIAPSLPSQTDTAWGRIWDDVPDSFPVAAGAEPATDTG